VLINSEIPIGTVLEFTTTAGNDLRVLLVGPKCMKSLDTGGTKGRGFALSPRGFGPSLLVSMHVATLEGHEEPSGG